MDSHLVINLLWVIYDDYIFCYFKKGMIDEKVKLETHTSDLAEELANERIELERYKTLLENEKGKVLELQQLHKAEDKSELEQLVENTRFVGDIVLLSGQLFLVIVNRVKIV